MFCLIFFATHSFGLLVVITIIPMLTLLTHVFVLPLVASICCNNTSNKEDEEEYGDSEEDEEEEEESEDGGGETTSLIDGDIQYVVSSSASSQAV